MVKPTGKQIRDALEYWRLALGLEDWTYTVRIGKMPNGDWGEADVDLPYKKIRFRLYPKGMEEEGESVDEMATHEWSHRWTEEPFTEYRKLCRTDEQRERCDALEEQLATDIARLILRLHRRPKP